MSFPKYERYKDSGMEWLGEVPEHWVIHKVSFDFSATKGSRGALLTKEYCYENSGLYPVYSGQTENDGVLGEIADFDFDLGSEGAILSTTVGAKAMSVMHITGRVSLSQNCMIIRASNKNVIVRFFFYHIQPLFSYERRMIPDHMQPSFRMEDLYSFHIGVPPIAEQTQIACFLDRETSRIDTLIEEQKRLIVLLKEKRQAVISHAVTKGLDSSVPMKDSGVEWLGEVPEHWKIVKLARVLQNLEQGWSPNASNQPADNGEWGVIKISAIKKGNFVEHENKALLEETIPDISIEVKNGDLLVTRANTPELVGDACIVKVNSGCRLMLSDLTYRLILQENIDAKFICYFLLSTFGRSQIKADARGSSMSMAKISQGHIKAWTLPLPPHNEQAKIDNYLSVELEKIDNLVEVSNSTHTLLQERRSALISAAVTGKIDIRNWNP